MTKRTILICDDEEGVRESFRLILEDRYDLAFASSGPEALDWLQHNDPAAAILDIKMPRLNGMETLKLIKKMKPALPVIIVTGYQSVETAQEALRAGAVDYIPKPFDSKQILKAVAAVQ